MKYIKKYENITLNNWIKTDFYFLDDLNISYDTIVINHIVVLRVQKKENPQNFLEIIQTPDQQYNVHVHSGTIQKPSTAPNARWYNLGNKYHDISGVLALMKGYSIISKEEYDLLLNSKKYNI